MSMSVCGRFFVPLALLLPVCLTGVVWGAPKRTLVQANFQQKMDSRGMRWDIRQDGQVNDGQGDCFDGGLLLQVGGHAEVFGRFRE